MPHSFSHHALANVPPTVAWNALQQPSVWEDVAGVEQVHDPRHDGDGHLLGYRFVVRAGPSTVHGTAETIEAVPPQRMRIAIDSPEIAGLVAAELTPGEDDMTLVTVSVQMRPKGLLAQLFYPIVAQAVRTGLPAQVQTFALKLGSG